MRAQRPDIEHLDADVAALGTPDDDVTTVLAVTQHLPARERAIGVRASQTSPFDRLPDDLRRAFFGTDHLRRGGAAVDRRAGRDRAAPLSSSPGP
jgi:hypothetical protein